MIYHILNGDALAEKFPDNEIDGQLIVIREAFIEGPLCVDFNEECRQKRKEFVMHSYDADPEQYENQFISQLRIMDTIRDEDEVCLWFEDDLFCLTNLWFSIAYISRRSKPMMYRIFPDKDEKHWSGFGRAHKKDLLRHYHNRQLISKEDIELSNQLWEAYVKNDRGQLRNLSFNETTAFRHLPQVIQAHLDRNPEDESTGRPQEKLITILENGTSNFYEIYEEFLKTESIYGFGDMQVLNLLREMEIDFEGEMEV